MTDIDTLARAHSERARATTANVSPPPVAAIADLADARRDVPRHVWPATLVILAIVLVAALVWMERFLPDEVAETPPTTVVTPTEALARLPDGCAWCPGIVLADGRALIIDTRTILSYDPNTEVLTEIAEMPDDLYNGSLLTLRDGRLLMVFGLGERAWIFEPDDGSIVATDVEYQQGVGGVGVVLEDGRVLLVVQNGPTWLYDPSTDETTEAEQIPDIGWVWSALPLDNGDVLFLGDRALIYDQSSGRFSEVESPEFAGGATATKLADGRVLIVGGQRADAPYETTGESFVYDPRNRTFTRSGSLEVPRWAHSAALLTDGDVLIVGGRGESPKGYDTVEIYDPVTGEFTLSDRRLSQPRVSSTVLALEDGSALVFGHYDGNVPIDPVYPNDTFEVFRP